MVHRIACGVLITIVGAAVACTPLQWGIPGVAASATSDDGRYVAFVRNHPDIDPWHQTAWLGTTSEPATKLDDLPGGAWSCDGIIWSPGGERVGFLISSSILRVYDVATKSLVYSGFIGRESRATPPRWVVQDVALSADGARATFRQCERVFEPIEERNSFSWRQRSVIRDCSQDRETVLLASLDAPWP